VYKGHGLPGSSILSLDDRSEYFTLAGNVVWCVGRAGAGTIGVRDQELGNIFIVNIRSENQYGDDRHCEGEPGHEKFDALYQRIKQEVDKAGGWPGNPDLPAMIERLKTDKNHYELTPEQIRTMKKIM
jgi:dihydroxyacid dehydratase/phosphogluconate dehydratase